MNRKKELSKMTVLMLALILVVGCVVGGTMAWLVADTDPVTNTFSPSTIDITLAEDTKKNIDSNDDYQFKMVPGDTFAKDPYVTVEAGSEACWLFVAITESANLDTFIDYGVNSGWQLLEGYTNIYYRSIDDATAKAGSDKLYILAGDATYPDGCVTIRDSVTKADMTAIAASAQPTLSFNACAVQSAHLSTVEAAWEQASEAFKELAIEVE